MNNIKDNLFDYLVCLMVLILPFSNAIPNIFLIVLSILFLKDLSIQKIKNIRFTGLILFAILVIYITLKAFVFETFLLDFPVYRGYLLALWLLVILHKVKDFKILKIFLLVSINTTVLASFFLIWKFYKIYHFLPFSNTGEVNELLILERPYAGFYAVLGIFLSLELTSTLKKYKFLLITSSVIMFVFIILISARLSILTIFLTAIIYLLFYQKTKAYLKTATILVLLLVFGAILQYNKNIKQRFFIRESLEKSIEIASNYEPRFVIWNCAYEMAKTTNYSLLFGLESYALINKNYIECYGKNISNPNKKDYFLTTNFNSHNQIIDYLLIGGLLAFFILAAFFIHLFSLVRKQFFNTALLVTIVFFFLVENVLYRQFGCYVFSIFVALLSIKKKHINDEN